MVYQSVKSREAREIVAGRCSRLRSTGFVQVFLAGEDHLGDKREPIWLHRKRILPIHRGMQNNPADPGKPGEDGRVLFAVVSQKGFLIFRLSLVANEVRNIRY